MNNISSLLLLLLLLGSGCISKSPSYDPVRNYVDDEKNLVTQFILAEDSSVIELKQGHFTINESLILDNKRNVVIKGQGVDKTILSFKNQTQGAEGILIKNCENIILKNFTIEDASGDNIKSSNTEGIIFNNIKSGWTGRVNEENGAYAIYPVLSKNVIIEKCEAFGASDAGIYVGQSENVIIRDNKTYWNVAGIESENSSNVEIYNNDSYNNSGGILIFDLPGLTRYGNNITAHHNNIYENNLSNFAPKGNIVGMVPTGTGLMVLATKDVDIYENTIRNNKTIGATIVSYELIAGLETGSSNNNNLSELSTRTVNNNYKLDKNYDPFPGKIYLHNNFFSNDYYIPALDNLFGKLFLLKFGFDRPFIYWDGIIKENSLNDQGMLSQEYSICIDESVSSVNLDLGNDMENMIINPKEFICNE